MFTPEETEIKTGEGMEQDYISAIQQIRDNSVSKESYNALREENKKLLSTLVSGGTIKAEEVKTESIEELRHKLFKEDNTNLSFWQNALKLRNAVIESGGEDPFVPSGSKISATANDYACAQKVADAIQSCIEYADGDSDIFTMELQRITKDTKGMR